MKDNWIELNLPWGPIYNGNEQADSFSKRGLDVPGVLVRVRVDRRTGNSGIVRSEDVSDYLIGHINPIGGICDDCTDFSRDSIVIAYKKVWSEENNDCGQEQKPI
jgi:hypothetical protein